jgi:hypothetical protein
MATVAKPSRVEQYATREAASELANII